MTFQTGTGYNYTYNQGKDKCQVTKVNAKEDYVKCDCNIDPNIWPKECILAFITANGQSFEHDYEHVNAYYV